MRNIGKCTECGAENVKVVHFDDGSALCESCLDSLYQQCDICKEYFDPGVVDFSVLKDGRFVCEYCVEEFDPNEFEDDEY